MDVKPPIHRQRSALQRKLDVVVPRVDFKSTSLHDAIEFLQQEAVRLDPEPDPARRGVKIVCDPPPTNPRITLTMSDLPLREALRYLAWQAGMEMKIDEEIVALLPAPAK